MAEAILRGTVIADGGLPCDARFQWGLTNALGTDTAWQGGNYNTGDNFSYILRNLATNITYFYRAQVRNAVGITSGAILSFTTPIAPPVILTVDADAISTGTGRVNGTIIADSGFPCQTRFEWGGSGALGNFTDWQAGSVAGDTFRATIGPLSPGSAVWFRAIAMNRGGQTIGKILTFTTISERGSRSGFPAEIYFLANEMGG